MSRLSVTAVASSASSSSLHPHPQHHQDALWQMNLKPNEQVDYGPYPVREGEPDCTFYIRTGLCRFGSTCRFNHPPNRKLAIATARMNGEYPERFGQPECQYYLKTGTCKFGGTCKFHHPRDRAGIAGAVALNSMGYPLRPNEIDCSYYMRNGHCKFGSTCKFNHPQPQNMMVSLRGSALYPQPVQSPNAGQLSYPLSRASFIANPQWQNPSTNYAPMVVPQGMGQVGSAMLSADQNQLLSTAAASRNIGSLNLDGEVVNQLNNLGVSVPMGYYVFPERPGQPECQFYMKTGDCKFGAVCKFHHPRDRQAPPPDSALSQLGLPLRPGEPICVFYSRYGICKFGPSCKFDHPMNIFGLINNNNKNTAIVVAAAAAAASSSPSDFHRLLAASTASAGGGVGLSFGQEVRVQKPSGESNVGSESM